jgi:opacity protein-like surface antigen
VRRSLVLALVVLLPAVARAGDLEVGVVGGYFHFNASNSASALFGSSGTFTAGAEVDYRLSHILYVGLGGRYLGDSGERVFVATAGSTVFPLMDEPLKMHMIPLEATIGYRAPVGPYMRPYFGLGPGVNFYHEESTVGGLTSSLDQTNFSFHVLGGLEFGRGSWRYGVELNFTAVPNAVGIAGVSKVYNEKDLGGISILGRIAFGTTHP